MLDDFQASFKVILDDSEIRSQISDLQKNIDKTSTLKLKIELADDSLDIRGLNNLLSKNFSNAGANAGQNFVKSLTSTLNNIHLVNGGVGNIKNILQGAGFDKASINAVTQDLNKMVLTINNIDTTQMRNGNIRMNITGIDKLNRAVTIVRDFDKETGKVINTQKKFSQSFKQVSDSAKNTLSNNIQAWMNKNGESAAKFKLELTRLQTQLKGNVSPNLYANIRDRFREIASEVAASKAGIKDYSSVLSNINLKLDTGSFKSQIDNVKTSFDSLKNKSSKISDNIHKLNKAFKIMNSSSATPEKKVEAYREFNTVLGTTRSQIANAAKVESNFAKSLKERAKATETLRKSNTLSNNIQSWMNKNGESAAKFKLELTRLQTQLKRNVSPNLYANIRDRFREIASEVAASKAGIKDYSSVLSNIELKIKTGDFKTKIESVKTSLESLANGSESAKKNIELLDDKLKIMSNSEKTPKEKIEAYREFNSILSTTRTQLSEAEKAERKLAQSSKESAKATETLTKSNTLSNNIQSWMNKNIKAAENFGDELRDLQEQLNNNESPETLRRVSLRFAEIKSEAKKLGLETKSVFSSIKDVGKQLLGLTSTLTVIQTAIRIAKAMYQNVYEIDTAMTNLKKVTDETDAVYSHFLSRSAKSAKELGSTVSDLITQTSEWAKLGYSLTDAEELSKLSSIYANVGEVSAETAVSDMITAIKAFKIETEDAVRIIDVYNELGNNFAISSAKLGEGITNSASALALAGADLEQASAMITGIAEITQNAPEAGNALKIFSMRIRGMKGELEELGEEVDDNIESISKVQTQILNLTHGEVNIFDDNGEFRNYYEIMKEIADIYDELNSTEQSSLAEILFGKQRGNAGAALIQAFQSGQIENAYQSAVESMGSAYAEQEKWMDSLQAKTQQLQAAWEELSITVMNSDFLKGLVDAGTTILTVLNDIIENIGVLNILLISLAAAKGIKSIS